MNILIRVEQQRKYPEVLTYFKSRNVPTRDVPSVIHEHKLYQDSQGILRVKSKSSKRPQSDPILLPKDSALTTKIIRGVHERKSHSGLYAIIREIRKTFWIEKSFSVVSRVLKSCPVCRRPYRDKTVPGEAKNPGNVVLEKQRSRSRKE